MPHNFQKRLSNPTPLHSNPTLLKNSVGLIKNLTSKVYRCRVARISLDFRVTSLFRITLFANTRLSLMVWLSFK
jgi:hypothetical protein